MSANEDEWKGWEYLQTTTPQQVVDALISEYGEWRAINKIDDAPRRDCLVAYTCLDQWATGDAMDDLNNLGAGVGHLTWSVDKKYWSITDDGESIMPSQVAALCPIPEPHRGLIVGRGAR